MRFQDLKPLAATPKAFERLQEKRGVVNARIDLRAPGLRGSASGIVKHAQANQYLVELYGRGELFMKVYYTGAQTVVWPAIGSPQIFSSDSLPTLRAAVHRLLPDWRLDDVLPVPFVRESDTGESSWAVMSETEFQQRIVRADHDVVYKSFRAFSDDSTFPFRKVTLQSESGNSRMTWRLQSSDRSTH